MDSDRVRDIGGPLTSSLVDDSGYLEANQKEWDSLLARSATDTPMLSELWLSTWWRVFGDTDGRALRIRAFHAGDRLVGLVPFLRRRVRHYGVLPMRRLEFLGTGERQEDEIMSEYLAPIVARGYEAAVAGALVRELASDPGDWHEVVMSALDGSAPIVAALQDELKREAWFCEVRTETSCPFIKLPNRWEAYVSSLGSSDRYMVKRSLREFSAWAGEDWRIERAATEADLARGRAVLLDLHRQRWEEEGRSGVFSSATYLRFHDEVMPRLLERKVLDLCWLIVAERPVAVAYNIIWRNRLYFYQGGRAMDVPKGVRPGVVLHLKAIQRSIEMGLSEYDFMGGPARYKMQLATDNRSLLKLRIARPGLHEAGRRLLESAATLVREARRRRGANSRAGSADSGKAPGETA